MKRLKILIILCSLITFIFADSKHYEYNETHVYKNLDYLKLDKEQYEKIKKVLIEYKHHFNKYYEKKKKEQKKLQKLFVNEQFDVEEYEEISEEIFEKAIELEAHTLKKIHKILTSTQREKFSHYLKEWQVE